MSNPFIAGSVSEPKLDKTANPYHYFLLSEPSRCIRLIRLMGHRDKEALIRCQIFEYPLQELGQGVHLYEALSYVWGSTEGGQLIYIEEGPDGNSTAGKASNYSSLHITPNLYAALSHLRNHLLDRVLWVDAICIDQGDTEEKQHQVQLMATIYASANRVVVWLGEASKDADGAFQVLCESATKEQTSPSTPQPVLALLKRPWFRRIWVLQEVAVARQVLIKCGPDELDGLVFCSGLDVLKLPHDTYPDLRSLTPPITYLIRHTTFWPQSRSAANNPNVPRSFFIRPLGQLADMYHNREATNPLDKVYALLGIGSPGPVEILPDYEAPWEMVFEKLIKLCLPNQISVRVRAVSWESR
ncbi:heterokaryon incompatibility protein-domain-containing protein [Immersiella caudata]|uniref:Heterokaryon incompatibility protein-domain-containing protein n=1 Tax=Immersiella caudata TaxID=314043 RepID=A0AA39WLQ5_9PEZI|nr:heterokaryon incompatibility protein-domain-containing protein [Immersiella caudata]